MSRPQPSRALTVTFVILIAAAVLGAALFAAIVLRRSGDIGRAAASADQAAEEFRRAGWPWEATDLPAPAPTSGPNLQKALAEFKGDAIRKEYPTIEAEIQAGDLLSAASSLSSYNEDLALADKVAGAKTLNFKRDWDLGPNILFPEYAALKNLARELCLRAELEASRHQVSSAVRDIKAVWRLGTLTAHEPILIAMLVALAVEAMDLRAVQHCTYFLRRDAGALSALSGALEGPPPPQLQDSLRGEAYIGLAITRNIKAFGGVKFLQEAMSGKAISGSAPAAPDPSKLLRTGLPDDTESRAYAARHLQLWTKIRGLIDRYPNDSWRLGEAMDNLDKDIAKQKDSSQALNRLLMPIFSEAGKVVVRMEAELTATRAVLVAARIHAKTAKWPNSIKQIPGKWIDPFNSESMHIRNDGTSFRVYSVGPNLQDDGGVFRNEQKDPEADSYDIGAAFAPPGTQ